MFEAHQKPAAYVIIEPESAYDHLPPDARWRALRDRKRAIREANRMIRSGEANKVDVDAIPSDAVVYGGRR